jgi:hypothetical protein
MRLFGGSSIPLRRTIYHNLIVYNHEKNISVVAVAGNGVGVQLA